MTPYILLGVLAVGMGLSTWLVLRWERQDRKRKKTH